MLRVMSCVIGIGVAVLLAGCPASENNHSEKTDGKSENGDPSVAGEDSEMSDRLIKTDAEWRKILTPEQYRILRQKGTEARFSGKYDEFFEDGIYVCAACGQPLFDSKTKYNSQCGWPAFYDKKEDDNIDESRDTSHGMTRTEVTCSRCGGHLGHVFNDGPEPTGLRYCINSDAMKFIPRKELEEPVGGEQ